MAGVVLVPPKFQFLDAVGNPLANGKVDVYLAGTVTRTPTWQDQGQTTLNQNPILLDGNGSCTMVVDDSLTYKLVVKDENNVVQTHAGGDNIVGGTTRLSQMSFTQDGAGAVTRDAQDKMRDAVSVKDFGAVGDGVADETAEVQAAANIPVGTTHKITNTVSLPGRSMVFENTTLDMSELSASDDYGISCAGTQGAAVALTADILKGAAVVQLASTANFTGDYAWLQSTTVFEAGTNTPLGQIVKIKSIDSGTQITLHDDVLYDFTTAASATLSPLDFVDNITLRNVTLIGSDANTQAGLCFDKCSNVTIEGCRFRSFDFTGIKLNRCLNVTVRDNTFEDGHGAGLSYGVMIGGGTYNYNIDGNTGFDLRHLVTAGDNTGVNLFGRITNNHAYGSRDAGIDSHPASDHLTVSNNTVECAETSAAFTPRDGIIVQGRSCTISDNTVVGARNYGIIYESYTAAGFDSSVTISGNRVKDGGPSGVSASGIRCVNKGASAIAACSIVGNTVDSADLAFGIHVYADTGNITNLTIADNVIPQSASDFGVYVQADAGNTISDFSVSNNRIKSTQDAGIFLFGATAPNILNGIVSGNTISGGGVYGVRYTYCDGVTESGNRIDAATSRHFIDAGSVSIDLDRRQSTIRTTTNSASTVADEDKYIIVNRAGTHTMTLPSAASHTGREITVKTVQAQAVDSASSNVVPAGDTAAGTAILPATDGAWAMLKSDGTNWVVLAKG